jgi:hypothetical protein
MITIDFITIKLNTLRKVVEKGYTMIICNNAVENFELIKHSDPLDLWFHSCVANSNINIILKCHGEFISPFYLNEIKTKLDKENIVMYTEVKNLIFKEESPGMIFPENIKLLK